MDNMSSPLELIRGEVAIMKKLNHDNIVQLYEVLDASAEDSMFMGMYTFTPIAVCDDHFTL